jgi:hypothetical protein
MDCALLRERQGVLLYFTAFDAVQIDPRMAEVIVCRAKVVVEAVHVEALYAQPRAEGVGWLAVQGGDSVASKTVNAAHLRRDIDQMTCGSRDAPLAKQDSGVTGRRRCAR